jgi:hypothetical protein
MRSRPSVVEKAKKKDKKKVKENAKTKEDEN